MSTHTHIIYLPGLGDRYDFFRRACLKLWQFYGARVTIVPMQWGSDELYGDKRARAEVVLRRYTNDERVVLMGESAGGSMALALYAAHSDRVAGVMTLCGKNTRADNVLPRIYARNPAFRDAMHAAEIAAAGLSKSQRRAFVSVVPWYDPTVPVSETLLSDCQKMRLPVVGHLLSILLMLTVYAPCIVRRAKKLRQPA